VDSVTGGRRADGLPDGLIDLTNGRSSLFDNETGLFYLDIYSHFSAVCARTQCRVRDRRAMGTCKRKVETS
jgi:hypothetical protein